MSEERVLRSGEFTRKVIPYYLISTALIFVLTIVLIPLAILWIFFGAWYMNRWLDRLSAELTEKRLEVKKGILFKRESTIPLDKITDLQYFQGPLMRAFDIDGLKVETAGQSGGAGGSLVTLIGLRDARGFRDAVLAQRDRRAAAQQPGSDSPSPTPAPAPPVGDDQVGRLLDAVLRIERLLERPGER